jgi:hypothetical protein
MIFVLCRTSRGEDVRHQVNITGFQSSAIVAGKQLCKPWNIGLKLCFESRFLSNSKQVAGKKFCHGVFEVIIDVAVYTYHRSV